MSLTIYYIIYYIITIVASTLKAVFGISSLWYIVNGVVNGAIIFMFLLYFVAFIQSRVKKPDVHKQLC